MSKKTTELYDRILLVLEQHPGKHLSPTEVRSYLSNHGISSNFDSLKRVEKLLWRAADNLSAAIAWKVGSGVHFLKLNK